jgi:hypothetical protein
MSAGQRSRGRRCKPGKNGGLTCQELLSLDDDEQDQPVNPTGKDLSQTETGFCAGNGDRPVFCPQPMVLTEWTPWANCSATCGRSERTRCWFSKHFTGVTYGREYSRGKYHCTVDLLFDWFELVCLQIKTKLSVVIQLSRNQSNRRSMVQWYFPL